MGGPPGAGKSMLASRLPVHPAAARSGGAAGSFHGGLGRWRHRGRRADQPAAVPVAASFRQHAGSGRRRHTCAAERNLACHFITACLFPSTNCFGIPRRKRSRLAAAAVGDRRGLDRARQSSGPFAGARPAGGGEESRPLRPRQRPRLYLPPRRQYPLRRRLPGGAFRAR